MRQKRLASKVIELAAARIAALESIDPPIDLGPDMTLASFKALHALAHSKHDAYNALLAEADEAQNDFELHEKKLHDVSTRMLAGIGAKFGRDSSEYEMLGGRRTSERKRPVRKPAAPKP